MKEFSFEIPSMHDECAAKEIESILMNINGIEDTEINYEDGKIYIYYDENHVLIDKIKYSIEKKGYYIKNII